MAPAHNLFDFFLFSFEQGLYAPVREVPDPASHAQAKRNLFRAGAKVDPLDQAMDDHMGSEIFHRSGFSDHCWPVDYQADETKP